MSRIKSEDTTPEMALRSFLHRAGFRYRLHVKTLSDKPDIVLPKYKTVIEVRGCFWHRHLGCKIATTPSTNTEYWQKKFAQNVERDNRNEDLLKQLGWNVVVIWSCELSSQEVLNQRLSSLFQQQILDKKERV